MEDSSLEKEVITSLKFPLKLWTVVNKCRTDAISWDSMGQAIVVKYSKFEEEYLQKGIFKTNKISSFVRQLNLYGFRKVYRNAHDNKSHVFYHKFFKRDKKSLISEIKRKSHLCVSKKMIKYSGNFMKVASTKEYPKPSNRKCLYLRNKRKISPTNSTDDSADIYSKISFTDLHNLSWRNYQNDLWKNGGLLPPVYRENALNPPEENSNFEKYCKTDGVGQQNYLDHTKKEERDNGEVSRLAFNETADSNPTSEAILNKLFPGIPKGSKLYLVAVPGESVGAFKKLVNPAYYIPAPEIPNERT